MRRYGWQAVMSDEVWLCSTVVPFTSSSFIFAVQPRDGGDDHRVSWALNQVAVGAFLQRLRIGVREVELVDLRGQTLVDNASAISLLSACLDTYPPPSSLPSMQDGLIAI